MNKKIPIFAVVMTILLSIGVYLWLQKNIAPAPRSGTTIPTPIITPIPTSTQPVTKIKNPTISNRVGDLVGNNNFDLIGLVWDRDDRAAEYILFRAESISGPFVEIDRVRTGAEIRTNYTDITPDAQIKTLCYKIEAKDDSGKTVRIYGSVCVLPWQN